MKQLRLQEELRKARRELMLLYEIGNLIRRSLYLDEVLYLILSAVTSHEGMGYNRAMIFLINKQENALEGRMGIGPKRPEASQDVWRTIKDKKITLEGLLDVYRKADKNIDPELNTALREVRVPLSDKNEILVRSFLRDEPLLATPKDIQRAVHHPGLLELDLTQVALVPLRGKDRVIGVLLADNVSTKKALSNQDLRRLVMLANHAGLAVENALIFDEVMLTSQQDSLTKLWNHGHFQKLLHDALHSARLNQRPVSLIVFDVDNFKAYNDAFGHQAGDHALESISESARTVMRRKDYLARYGGEEFAAVLTDTTKEEALKFAERLQAAVTEGVAQEPENPITISLGVAAYPEDAEDKEKLIFCADGALYEAKRSGKNKICSYKKSGAGPA